ncbi:amino acid adenylation domain-containing protein, partial [Variovorax boronicumulans]
MQACPGVREAVVLARGEGADKQLVAYVTGEDIQAQALREQLATRLPEYMVPAAYVQLEALPLTPNGKLDRRALPAPGDAAYGTREFEPPQGEIEEELAQIWQDLLGLERVGRADNFFALGGHSLLAVQLIERMRRIDWELPVRALFTAPTLAALAEQVRRAGGVVVPPNLIAAGCERITPEMLPLATLTQQEIDTIAAGVDGGVANVQDIYALAPLQQGILFHHLASSEADPYLLNTLLAFDTREQLDAFVAAMDRVIARHDILRTAFVWRGLSEAVQVVWRHAALPVVQLQLEQEDAAAELLQRPDLRHTRIDVQRAPLLHAHVAHDRAQGRWLLKLLHHHLVMDHTTLELLVEEVQAHLGGRERELPAPLAFRNFVAQARLGLSPKEHEAYFSAQLGDVDETTAPYGLLDVRGDGNDVREVRLALPPELSQSIRQQAKTLGVSAASFFHLAFALALASTSGRNDVVFATTLFGRMMGGEGAQRALGLFLNTLPLRVKIDRRGVREALVHTHAALAELLEHEHAPLALAQRASGIAHPAPLFTAMLNYRHAGGAEQLAVDEIAQARAWEGTRVLHEHERTNYPLVLSVNDEHAAGFSLDVQMHASIEPERMARQMAGAVEQLVQALRELPATPLAALRTLPPSELEELRRFNATDTAYPQDQCIHALFEAQAQRAPDAVALVFEDESLSYAELDARANRLAHHLQSLGVGPDARVALLLERGVSMVVALLATLKAGGAYVPLDPSHPAERLAFMLEDCAPLVVLSDAACLRALALPEQLPVCRLDDPAAPWLALPGTAPAAAGLTPGQPAYVIYTSGSTGTPKGVLVSHRAVVKLIINNGYAAFEATDRIAFVANPAFDASTLEVWAPLLHGAAVVVVDTATLLQPHRLAAYLTAHDVNVLHLTAGLLEPYRQALAPVLRRLRYFLTGGDRVSVAAVAAILADSPPRQLIHCYGPTETTTFASTHIVREVREGAHSIPLGRPIANTCIHILGACGEPVPIGVSGEIHVGGAGVADGYLNRPELTAERFVPDPFAAIPGARMYRTGDVGRWLPDGTIEFLGRNDHQVKIRGFRVELGEIEAALQACPGVREAVVLARGEGADKQLVAYVTGDVPGGEDVQAQALREQLASRLPEYMVPAAYVQLEALPLTPNGKLDRRALPAPGDAAYGTREFKPPQGPIEETLAEIWQDLLGLERIGRADNFFELGGHSLLAVQLASRIRSRLGLEMAIAELFAQPTLAAFAARLATAAASDLPAVTPAGRGAPLPLSFAQQRLWFLEQLDEHARLAYLMPSGLRLVGPLDESALVRALDRILARHEVLRTCFVRQDDGSTAQVIATEDVGLPLLRVDLTASADPQAEARRHAQEEAATAFDLSRGPLIRARLLKLAEQEHVLLVTMHHIVSDGWSMGVLINEFSALYAAFSQGRPDPLPALPIQYADYAVWQRRWLAGDVLHRQL